MAPSGAAGDCGNAAGSSRGKEGDPRFDLLLSLAKQMVQKQRRIAAEKASTVKKARQAEAGGAVAESCDEDFVFKGRAHAVAPAAEDPAETAVGSPEAAEAIEGARAQLLSIASADFS